MTALGMMALYLRIAELKFTHNFIICNRLPDTEIIFGIDIQKKFFISYAWDKAKNCYIQKDGKFLTYTRNCKQEATIGIVKLTLKIPPRHNGIIPIKITGQALKEHMATSLPLMTKQKARTLISTPSLVYMTPKEKTSVNILVSSYTNKHFMFNKGEYTGCLEPAIEDSANSDLPSHNQ